MIEKITEVCGVEVISSLHCSDRVGSIFDRIYKSLEINDAMTDINVALHHVGDFCCDKGWKLQRYLQSYHTGKDMECIMRFVSLSTAELSMRSYGKVS